MEPVVPTPIPERRRWTLRGQLQGVGFRPFVYRLANELSLSGFVRNESSAVVIEAEGPVGSLDQFEARLGKDRPVLAQIYALICHSAEPTGMPGFAIEHSRSDEDGRPIVPADTAICPECLRELFDNDDFRYRYPLINCTNCGPRYSIIRAMPYDRANTTMRYFQLCEKCHQQYVNAADRRFHAQPVACPTCGPKLGLFDFRKSLTDWDGSLVKAARLLHAGRIVAIKGIGGFHLACRADDAAVIRKLRSRKHRDNKPFALMVRDIAAAERWVELSADARTELAGPAAPIVLAPRKAGGLADPLMALIAHGTHRLGILLPYTPLHHLLFAQTDLSEIDALVMTSANVSDEPLVRGDEEAFERLADIADAVLFHQRPIERSVDDSVLLDMGTGEPPLPIRRGRGYVPQSIFLQPAGNHASGTSLGLCVGGELKSTVAVVRGDEVIVSHHLGDLKHPLAYEYFRKAIDDLCSLHELHPQWIAHDLHPAYLSTQWAGELAKTWNVPLVAVQHHHAHAAAVLAEHGIAERALAIVCDGVGYGTDGTAWGGELLLVDMPGGCFERMEHLRPILLPGGDVAARETRRCAAGVMHALGRRIDGLFGAEESPLIEAMLASGKNCVSSSAAGRLFDAVAALLGVCALNTHEAEAGMALEALAQSAKTESRRQKTETAARDGVIDLLPLVAELGERKAAGEDVRQLSAQFHEEFCRAWAEAAAAAARRVGVTIVGLSGGVFCNQIVSRRLTESLRERGLTVLRHEMVPPNDGGIAFGQAAVAVSRLSQRSEPCA